MRLQYSKQMVKRYLNRDGKCDVCGKTVEERKEEIVVILSKRLNKNIHLCSGCIKTICKVNSGRKLLEVQDES